jgi:hypothetical protein
MVIFNSELLNYRRVNDVNSGFSVWDHVLSIGFRPIRVAYDPDEPYMSFGMQRSGAAAHHPHRISTTKC